MCPLWPFHTIIMYLMMMIPLWFMSCKVMQVSAAKWSVRYNPQILNAPMYDTVPLQVTAMDFTKDDIDRGKLYLKSDKPDVASVISSPVLLRNESFNESVPFTSIFNIDAKFLGTANVRAVLQKGEVIEESDESARVNVLKRDRIIDKAFIISLIVLVSIIYINFGCALDLNVMKEVLRRPIGPIIGLLCQFIIMPILSFSLGQLLFSDSTPLQLGLFFTGIAPAGGASNIWTVTLGGNLNLSVTMTAVSTFFAFIMMPLWVFTLGKVIFDKGSIVIPYGSIGRSAISLVVPLVVGAGLQIYCPKFAKMMARILKPFSALLLVFIIIFATITNLFLFKLFTWQIAVAGLCLPLFGYVFGGAISRLCKQVPEDSLAIAIETGVQNTGIAIFMLRYALDQPEADMTMVAPVAVALMTPVPLLCLYVLQRCTTESYHMKKSPLSISTADSEHNYIPYSSSTGSDRPLTGHV